MTSYNKLLVAAAGFAAVLFGPDFLGVVADAGALEARLVEFGLAAAALFGVWRVPNAE